MRASEARLTLAVVSLRDGDLDGAADWAATAFSADRKSIKSLTMVAEELHNETRTQYGDDPAPTHYAKSSPPSTPPSPTGNHP
jgi:Tfp pilus assembly protein PilF